MTIGTYLAAAALVAITPGADTFVVINNTLKGGFIVGFKTVVGVCLGLTIWAIGAIFGFITVIASNELIFAGIRIAGAVYLIYLGVRTLVEHRSITIQQSVPGFVTWRRGVLTNLGNPKVGLFYLSFLPQFLPAHHDVHRQASVLAMTHIAFSLVFLTGYAFLAANFEDALKRSRWRIMLNSASGAILCVIGMGVIASLALDGPN